MSSISYPPEVGEWLEWWRDLPATKEGEEFFYWLFPSERLLPWDSHYLPENLFRLAFSSSSGGLLPVYCTSCWSCTGLVEGGALQPACSSCWPEKGREGQWKWLALAQIGHYAAPSLIVPYLLASLEIP